MQRKLVLVVEYDGTGYRGFQLQPQGATIQGELETAIRKLTGEKLRVVAASRTDAGVHAVGQVVSFRTGSALPPATVVRALNFYLPPAIAVKAAYEVAPDFDVQRQARSREYRYSILNSATPSPLRIRTSYWVPRRLEIGAMNQACACLLGKHDFASFTSPEGTAQGTVHTVYRAEVSRDGDTVTFDMEADSFLRHQVRLTVGSLIRVGLGKLSPGEFEGIVEAAQPGRAGPSAPAHGLCLRRVNYAPPLGDLMNEDI
ncbi:MAG TPA: tRNA pseudouridine(38-40) synthase TruA [Dehalococcoidia bacterium]|nr:tRNA pseudouridine(38-40) synthase TruA [Dehalococcoidia bacterium]